MRKEYLAGITKLGANTTEYLDNNPVVEILERFLNKNGNILISVKAPEFSSKCPKTGQPDFATIHIQYVPDKWCVESKSLKLYLFAFRQYGSFMEDITSKIADDLFLRIRPFWLRVIGDFYSRGGISIVPVVERNRGKYMPQQHILKMPVLHTNHSRME